MAPIRRACKRKIETSIGNDLGLSLALPGTHIASASQPNDDDLYSDMTVKLEDKLHQMMALQEARDSTGDGKEEVGTSNTRNVGTKLDDHIDEFNKLILDLANIDIEIKDEDQAVMLLTSLSSSYENCVETLLYERESLTMEDVLATLNPRELKKRTEAIKEETGDGLYVRGRSDHSGEAHSSGSLLFKSRGKTGKLKCFICHSKGHLKRDCPMKKSSGFVKKGYTVKMQMGKIKHGGSKQVGLKKLGSKQVRFKQLGLKQVRFKQLGPGVETGVHGVQDEKRVWFEEKVHLGIKVGANITVIEVPAQEGAEGNVAEKKKVKESMKANLGK
nr:zinc finger, CCHC-type [Tanacetum cinerariifolium]